MRRCPRSRAFLLTVPLLAPLPFVGEPYELLGGFPAGQGGGDVRALRTSADGAWVAYVADEERFGVLELFAAPADGSAPAVKLSGAPCEEGNVSATLFEISPTSTRVVYCADQDEDEVVELWSAPIDGSSAAVQLNASLAAGGDVDAFRIAPDGARVVYLADQAVFGRADLWSVPIDGSAAPVRLSSDMGSFGDVATFAVAGARAVYTADAAVDGRVELHAAPIDGSAPPVQLSSLPASGAIGSFEMTTTGDAAVYRQSHPTGWGLYRAPCDGSAAALALTPATIAQLESLRVDPTGTRAVYRAATGAGYELWSVPLDASAAPVRLHAPLAAGRDVLQGSYAITADGARVLWIADALANDVQELWSAPLDGSAAEIRLNGTMVAGGDVQSVHGVAAVASTARVVYLADQDNIALGLYTVPADGSAPAVKLSAPLPYVSAYFPAFQPELASEPFGADTTRAAFAVDSFDGQQDIRELYSVPVDASAPPVKVHGTFAPGGELRLGWRFAGARVVYVADEDTLAANELYGAALDGSTGGVKLNGSMSSSPPTEHATIWRVTPDGSRVVCLVESQLLGGGALYSVLADGSGSPVRLTPPFLGQPQLYETIQSFDLADGGARVVYVVYRDATGGSDSTRMWSVPVDGSAPPVDLGLGPQGFVARVSPDGEWVIASASRRLFRIPADGSAPAVAFTPTPPGLSQGVVAFEVTPASDAVVFTQDLDVGGKIELYGVPLDGSAPPLKLNPALVANGDCAGPSTNDVPFEVSPDGAHVIYLADQQVDERFELWSVPIGGGSAVRLNGALGASGDVLFPSCQRSFAVTPDSTRVVYAADQLVDGRVELFGVPIGGGSALALCGAWQPTGDVAPLAFERGFELSATGRVVYLADQEAEDRLELFSVPAEGGAVVKLNGELVAGGDVSNSSLLPLPPAALSADGRFVVYRADQDVDERQELYARRTDGSGAPVKLNAPLPSGGDLERFAIDPRGRRVAYLADLEADQRFELFDVAIGGGASVKRNGPLVARGDVASFLFGPGGVRLFYAAEQDLDGAQELFALDLRATPASATKPASSALPTGSAVIVR